MNAGYYDCTTLWGFCQRYGNKNADWIGLGKKAILSMEQAHKMIKMFRDKDYDSFTLEVRGYIPGFELNRTPDGTPRIPVPNPVVPEKAKEKAKLPKLSVPEKPKKTYDWKKARETWFPPACADEVAQLIEGGCQVCLFGKSGTGKDALLDAISKVLDRKFFQFSMGGGTRFQHLFYSIEIVNGDTQIKLMPFLVAIQTPDSIVVLDEIMSMDEDIALALNSILEKSQRYMNTPLGEIKVHPTCTIVATSNTNGREISDMYTGTKRQDESLIKRFVQYNMDYDLGIEDKIMGCLLDEEKDYISRNLKQLRYKIKEGQLSYDASTRQVCQTIELIAGGIDYKRAYWLAFMSPLSESERLQVGTPS